MTFTLLRLGWLNLKRDGVALALTFLLPVMFFSIFATIFGQQRTTTRRVSVAVVDEDGSDYSKKLVKALQAEGGLAVQTTVTTNGTEQPLSRAAAERLVKDGKVPVAVVVPKGLGENHRLWSNESLAAPKVQLLADVSDPVAPQMVQGLLQKVSFTAAPESMAEEGMAMFERYGGALTPGQKDAQVRWRAALASGDAPAAGAAGGAPLGLPVELVNVMQPGQGPDLTISFYAAGTGVMFLLFSCAGAGGAMLDEQESGTLGRLIGSRAGMGGVLFGKWLFLSMVAITQLTVMFTWGAVVFGLPLMSHLPGFIVMTTVTAAAAAGFGLFLATISRTRAQLSGLSTIIILAMSALGGSMFPRFMMSDTMKQVGRATFNAWALDGYLKVFWQEAPIRDLWLEVSVLAGLTVVFLAAARMFARRWETA